MTLVSERWTTLRGVVKKTTRMAVLFAADTDEWFSGDRWVPRSVVEDGQEVDVGDVELAVRHWWLSRRRA